MNTERCHTWHAHRYLAECGMPVNCGNDCCDTNEEKT